MGRRDSRHREKVEKKQELGDKIKERAQATKEKKMVDANGREGASVKAGALGRADAQWHLADL